MTDGAAARDRHVLYVAAFVRALATGLVGVHLGLHLATIGASSATIGVIVGAGLAGAAFAALLTTLFADRVGKRRTLLLVTLLAAIGGAAVVVVDDTVILGVAAFVGMLNGMGRDRGAALIIEQAMLPAMTDDAGRTAAFARYNVLQDVGHAFGGLAAGLSALFANVPGVGERDASTLTLALFPLLMLASFAAYLRLARDTPRTRTPQATSPATKRVLVKISALFALDSLGGGFLVTSLLSYFFFERFAVGGEIIGALFFVARILNALSHFAAAQLAKRIGLVNTMVLTHIPSSLLLVTVAYAPSFPVAAALFLLREALVEMDVPTRQSYVMALVRPEERTLASGVTHVVRMAAWAVAPFFAGAMMHGASLALPLVIGAAIKIVYDVALWVSFRRLRPPEERSG